MRPLERSFSLAFYRWAIHDASRELGEGFPLLRRIQCAAVTDYMEFTTKLTRAQMKSFVIARVKSALLEGCFLAGESISQSEKSLLERYGQRNIIEDSVLGRVSVTSRARLKLRNGPESRKVGHAIRTRLRSALKEELSSIFDVREENFGSAAEWRYTVAVGRWNVATWIDTGKRFSPLSYSHTVTSGHGIRLAEHLSIFTWLGIPARGWDVLMEADIQPTAQLVRELICHFTNAIRELESQVLARTNSC